MSAWVPVSTSELAQLIEIETDEDGKLPLASITLHFPGTTSLKFCNHAFYEKVQLKEDNFLAPQEGWGISTRYIAVGPTSDIKHAPKKGDVQCTDMVLFDLKLNTTEAQVREYFKDVEVLGVHMKQSRDNLTKYAFIKFSDWEVARVLGRQTHSINGTLCSLRQNWLICRNNCTQSMKRKATTGDFGEAESRRIGGNNFGDPSWLSEADGSMSGKVGRVEDREQENRKHKVQVLKMKSLIIPLKDEVVRQKSVLEDNVLLLSKKGEEIRTLKEEIAAKDKLIEEQTKLITSLAHQVEKARQKSEEKREEFEATKTKFRELETRSRWCPPSWCSKCLLDKCWCPPGSIPDLGVLKPPGWIPPNLANNFLWPVFQGTRIGR